MWCYTLFPIILNMSLTAGIVIVLVLLARLPLKKAPRVFSYALWAVVLFRLLCPISFSTDFSLLGIFHSPAVTNGSITYIPTDIVHTANPQVDLPLPGISQVNNETLPQGGEQTVADPLEAPMAIATFLWLFGIMAMLIYSIASVLILKNRLKSAQNLEQNIYEADNLKTPFVLGIFKPRIFIPTGLTREEKSYIIRHEQTHIRRLDHIIKPFAFMVLSLHWFNPLVWIAFVLMGADMELSCDEKVIKEMGGEIKKPYAASLLSLATGKRILNGSPLAFGEGNVKGRIKNVLNYRKPRFWMMAVAVVAVITVGIGLLVNPVDDEPDLSFLKPANLIALISEIKQIEVTSAEYGATYVSGSELAKWLDNAENDWSKKLITPSEELETTIAVFIPDAIDHSICFFSSDPSLALVVYGDEKRYYNIPEEDYEAMEEVTLLGSRHVQNIVLTDYKDRKAAASVTVTDTEAIKRMSVMVLNGDQEKPYATVDDIPPVADYIRIDFKHFEDSQTITYYVYSQADKSYLEKPYSRISKINSATMQAIAAILSGQDTGTQSGLTFTSSETDLIRLGTIAFDAHMATLTSGNLPVSDRIAAYQLNHISVVAGNINEFCVSLNYDFTTDNESYVNPSRGAKGKGIWTDNSLEIRVRHIEKNKFEIISIGTGGGGQGLTPYAAEQTSLEPLAVRWSPEQSIDTIGMAELDYASDDMLIFHGYFGLFIYDLKSLQIIRSLDLKPLNCTAIQGDDYCDVTVSTDGNTVQLHRMSSNNMYVYTVSDNTLQEMPYERMSDRFGSNFVPIEDVVDSKQLGHCSHNAVKFGTGEYGYLHTSDWTLGTFTYVRGDRIYRLFDINASEDTNSQNSAGAEIVDSLSGDLITSHSDVEITNEWISKDFGYTVLFGSLKNDPQQGVAVVIPTGDQKDKNEQKVLTPEKHGAIKAESLGAKASILDVVAEDGYRWIFNVYNGFDPKK